MGGFDRVLDSDAVLSENRRILMNGRVLVIEEHPLIAIGLQLALEGRSWDVEAISRPTTSEVVERAASFEPDCVLLDIYLGAGMGSGLELIGPMASTGSHVVVFTSERRRTVLAECLEAGASCWVGKSAALDELDAVLHRVLAGDSVVGRTERALLLHDLQVERVSAQHARELFRQLTDREALVLVSLLDGLSAQQIAETHFVALSTVRSQIRSLLQKLGVRSQLAAVALADGHRELLPPPARPVHTRRRAQARGLIGCGPQFRQ